MNDFLISHAREMNIALSSSQVEQLIQYAKLIAKWNKTYNLTAITGEREILIHHILDSLSIIPFLDASVDARADVHEPLDILDIGAGAGLPSIVIAILTNHQVVSVDKVAKKCTFMQYIKAQLALDNLIVKHAKVEQLDASFDIITSRAFSSIHTTLELSSKLLKNNGKYLLLKGNNWQQEEVHNGIITPHNVVVPQLSEQRYILEIAL